MDYTKPDYDVLATRNKFRSSDQIEMRRLAELDKLLGDWKSGKPVFDVLHDLSFIMDEWTFSPFTELTHRYADDDDDVAKARKEVTPYIKGGYLKEPLDESTKADIERFSANIGESTMTSFDIARSIVTAIAEPDVNKGVLWHPTENFLRMLDEEEERQKFEDAAKITGSLNPEPEKVLVKRLSPYIKQMRTGSDATGEKLINAMNIDASGSGMIKVFSYNPDYLPAANTENKDSHAESFDPYRQDFNKEDIYGTTTARITTYSISFEPLHPEKIDALREEVQRAVDIIGTIPPAFAIPTDYDAEGYIRPYSPEIDAKGFVASRGPDGYRSKDSHNTKVRIHESKVVVDARLDLDDTYNLYYLLEHRIKPGLKTAQALNTARFAESRSAPQAKKDLGSSYSVHGNDDPSLKVGDLSGYSSELLIDAIKAARALHATKTTDDETLIKQAIALAGHTLSGRITDAHGAFPPYKLLLSYNGSKDLSFPVALRERTMDMMQLMSGATSDTHIAHNLLMRAPAISEDARQGWQDEMRADSKARMDRWFTRKMSGTGDFIKDFRDERARHDKDLALSDAVAAAAKRNPELSATALALAGNPANSLTLREHDVEPCIDRTYPDTTYTSRLPGSPWARKDIPSKLKAFLEPSADVSNSASALLLEFQGGKKRQR